ncbi:MAG: very short patch repair endonuclease [Pseudomonadota bacterium]
MTDNLTPRQRRQAMRQVKSRNTTPEMKVRRLLHGLGFRYRLHVANLPGKPDLVFPKYKKVILVNGCFWHGHEGCSASDRPSSNTPYWNAKLDRNKKRDRENMALLREAGWDVFVIWECRTRNEDELRRIVAEIFPLGSE